MAQSYTPGLAVTDAVTLRRRRTLPLPGEVLVEAGEEVTADRVVARTRIPGSVQRVNLAGRLGVLPAEVPRFLRVCPGEAVRRDQVLAERVGFLRLFRSQALSPADGTLESVSDATGHAIVREPPRPVEVRAYVHGRVVAVQPGKGCEVEARAALVQGIFGLGGECSGRLLCRGDGGFLEGVEPDRARGAIVVLAGQVRAPQLRQARDAGIRAVVCGSIDAREVKDLLGRELEVAVTGDEEIGLTLVVTEGFGRLPMARRTFQLLERFEGHAASANGATQIRAGVQRPEVVIPRPGAPPGALEDPAGVLEPGGRVRVVRHPYFGATGRVTELPVEPEPIASEAVVRVVRLELDSGQQVTVPRANVEWIHRTR